MADKKAGPKNSIEGEIITMPEDLGNQLMVNEIFMKPMSPERLRAINSLATGVIPPEAVKQHPGKSGKLFTYLSHIWATKILNAGMKWLWEFNVQSYEAFEDGSAVALGRLTIHIPIGDGMFVQRNFTEVGAFESQPIHKEKKQKKIRQNKPGEEPVEEVPEEIEEETEQETNERIFGMTKAMRIASAASRSLLRCMLRAFDIGSEFYDDDTGMSNVMAWQSLEKFANGKGVSTEELIAFIKNMGIKKEQLADRYNELFTKLYTHITEKDSIPDDLD